MGTTTLGIGVGYLVFFFSSKDTSAARWRMGGADRFFVQMSKNTYSCEVEDFLETQLFKLAAAFYVLEMKIHP